MGFNCYLSDKGINSIENVIDAVDNRDLKTIDAISIAEQNGFRYIQGGDNRLVFEDDENNILGPTEGIVKVYQDPGKIVHIENEIRSWNRAKNQGWSEVLAPVPDYDDHGFCWLVQVKVELTNEQHHRHELIKKLNHYNINCGDLHTNHIGLLNNRPVIFDYGRGCYKQQDVYYNV